MLVNAPSSSSASNNRQTRFSAFAAHIGYGKVRANQAIEELMRPLLFIALTCIVGCGDSNSSNDQSVADLSMSAGADLSASAPDMTVIMPYNMPGKVFCYSGPACVTPGATSVCCDSRTDGGFADTCVASTAACLAMDSTAKVFECGQAADCAGNKVCCGDIGTSTSGKKFFNSTSCAASCTGTQTQLCVTAAECKASGVSCVGQSITGRAIGLCQ
jgi:hypothetical protein